MALTDQQNAFVGDLKIMFNQWAKLFVSLEDMHKIYFARTYSSLIDDDLAARELTTTQLSDMINAINAFISLLDNQAPTQGDWRSIINRGREL